jgi:hypothetical protein
VFEQLFHVIDFRLTPQDVVSMKSAISATLKLDFISTLILPFFCIEGITNQEQYNYVSHDDFLIRSITPYIWPHRMSIPFYPDFSRPFADVLQSS